MFTLTSSPLCTSPGGSHIPPCTLHRTTLNESRLLPFYLQRPQCFRRHAVILQMKIRQQYRKVIIYAVASGTTYVWLEADTAQVRLYEGLWHTSSHVIFTLHSEQGGMTSTLLKLCEVWSLAQGRDRESPAFFSISCTPEWAGLHHFMEVLFISTSGHHKYLPWPCLVHSRSSTIAFLHNDNVWPAFLQWVELA